MSATARIPTRLAEEISQHALAAYPEECCGILIGHRSGGDTIVDRVVEAANIAEGDRCCRYQVDWQALLATVRAARDGAGDMVGFYHSHPDGSDVPSEADREAAWVDFLYLIVPVQDGCCHKPRGWRVTEEGRPFERESVQEA